MTTQPIEAPAMREWNGVGDAPEPPYFYKPPAGQTPRYYIFYAGHVEATLPTAYVAGAGIATRRRRWFSRWKQH